MSMRIAALMAGLVLTGCAAVGPDYVRPATPIPGHWHGTTETGKTGQDLAHWWKAFHDPELDRLITEALAANLDLRKAAARIVDARSQVTYNAAAGLPQLKASNSVNRRLNSFSLGGTGSANPAGGYFGNDSQISNILQAGFDASWELDIFGGIRRSVEAAEAATEAERENLRDARVSLVGEVARDYIELRANQQRAAVTRANLEAQKETLALTRERLRMGLVSELDVAQQESQLANTEAKLPGYEAAAKQALHALAVLLGREPAALFGRLQREAQVPVADAEPWADLPSELLRRRPDIRRAERQVAEANAKVGVAVADMYPKVSLTAFLGLQNLKTTDFTPVGKSWSLASSVSLPLFNWGKLAASVEGKEAQRDQSVLDYQSTVLNAFKEVEDALVSYAGEQKRRGSLLRAVAASREALELASDRYRRGLTTFLDVLQTQQTLYQDQNSLVESEAQVSTDLVALYKALGGGWEQAEAQ